jgi:hypothetical protein
MGKIMQHADAHIIGPYRNPRVNDRGEALLNLMRESTYVDLMSFFKHKMYDTWVGNFENTSYEHDHVLIKFNGHKIKVKNAKVIKEGAQSRHLAIQLKLRIKTWKQKKKEGETTIIKRR